MFLPPTIPKEIILMIGSHSLTSKSYRIIFHVVVFLRFFSFSLFFSKLTYYHWRVLQVIRMPFSTCVGRRQRQLLNLKIMACLSLERRMAKYISVHLEVKV